MGHEFLLRIMVALSPIVFLSTDQRVIDEFDHVIQHSDRVGSDLSEQDLFVVGFIDIDLNKRWITFFLFSGKLRKNHTALSLIFSESPYVTKRLGSMTL